MKAATFINGISEYLFQLAAWPGMAWRKFKMERLLKGFSDEERLFLLQIAQQIRDIERGEVREIYSRLEDKARANYPALFEDAEEEAGGVSRAWLTAGLFLALDMPDDMLLQTLRLTYSGRKAA